MNSAMLTFLLPELVVSSFTIKRMIKLQATKFYLQTWNYTFRSEEPVSNDTEAMPTGTNEIPMDEIKTKN